jgi:rubrerythrin
MELQSNPFEAAARTKKRDALVAIIVLAAVGRGEDPFAPSFARNLHEAGQDFWKAAAAQAGCHEPSVLTQNEVVMFFLAAAAKKRLHQQDADCTLSPPSEDSAQECIVCHVVHGDPCPKCGGRGFHKPSCPEYAPC